MGLKILHRGPLEWHCHRTKFRVNVPSSSKVISGGHSHTDGQTDAHARTHTHTGDLISLLSFLESRLKIKERCNDIGRQNSSESTRQPRSLTN
jgi:hypothetical protein